MLDETPKVNQLEDDRFNRMEHFYGSDEAGPDTLEDFDLGDDGKVMNDKDYCLFFTKNFIFRLVMIQKICFIQIEKSLIHILILMRANIRMDLFFFQIGSIEIYFFDLEMFLFVN